MKNFLMDLKSTDAVLYEALEKEKNRQEHHLELIASENYVSKSILELQGSIFTNKYAEGYPEKRYYGGCEYVDIVEKLAIERAKKIFNVSYVNVQPHSGSQANQAVFMAILKPGDTILGMDLSNGGHLTHGGKMNVSGKIYHSYSYGLKNDGYINYEEVEELAIKYKPKLIIAGASAYSRIIDWQRFSLIAKKVDAFLMADIAHYAGLIASDIYPSPVGHADFITTTTHKTLRGPRGGMIMATALELHKAGVSINVEKALNSAIFPVLQGGPLMHVIAAKAKCFEEVLNEDFKKYAKQVILNARVMATELMENGFNIVSNGTDSHMFLLDLQGKNLNGKEAEDLLQTVSITVNKNSVPNDPQKPHITSGIRIGTAAMTTRGMGEKQAHEIAQCISQVINDIDSKKLVKEKIEKICKDFPVYHQ